MTAEGSTVPRGKSCSNLGETQQYFTVTKMKNHPPKKDTFLNHQFLPIVPSQGELRLKLEWEGKGNQETMDFLVFNKNMTKEKKGDGGGERRVSK